MSAPSDSESKSPSRPVSGNARRAPKGKQRFEAAESISTGSFRKTASRPFTFSRARWGRLVAAAAAFAVFTVSALFQPPRPLPHPRAELRSIAFWRYPVVTNEINRLPRVLVNGSGGPRFNAVWVAPDGKGIWIAGEHGILLHSRDGGSTWLQLQPRPDHGPATASTDRRSWVSIPVVEAASVTSTLQSAAQSGPASGSQEARQSSSSQQQPFPVRGLQGQQINPAPNQLSNPSQKTNSGSTTPVTQGNPVYQSTVPNRKPFANAPSQTKTPDISRGGTPANRRPATAQQSQVQQPRPGLRTNANSGHTSVTDCQLQGRDLVGVYFASESTGYVKTDTQVGDSLDGECGTDDSGASWHGLSSSPGLGVAGQQQIDSALTKSHSLVVTLANGNLVDYGESELAQGSPAAIRILTLKGTRSDAATNTTAHINAISFADMFIGIAVGESGAVIKTVDGGYHWFPIFQGPEGKRAGDRPSLKFPAPWYYFSWLVVGLIAAPALRKPTGRELQTEETIANVGVSDRPLEPTDADPLGFRNLALSISRFLRNENTIAPITIAITGDWGTGKSSIMNLLRRDLASRGFRPIWFNAWHNQTEEDLFATILQALRKEGVPQWWDVDYFPFRIRLLMKRWRSRWPAVTLLLAAIAFLGGIEWDHLKGFTIASFFASFRNWESLIKSLEGLHGTFWTLLACLMVAARELYRGLRAFGVDPASLLAAKSGVTSLAELEKQTSLRQRFAEELKEVTSALGMRRRMTLFIDDLDRCMPENIRIVLEAINFIVTAGECYVIMALARGPVEAGVGLSFDRVAAELTWSLASNNESAEDLAKRKRWQFSRQYLDKLINIEIPARPVSDARVEELVLGSDISKGSSARLAESVLRCLRIVLPALSSAALIAATCTAGLLIGRSNLSDKPSRQATTTQASGLTTSLPSVVSAGKATPSSPPNTAHPAVSFTVWTPAPFAAGMTAYSLPLLALAVLLYMSWRMLRKHEEVIVKDSPRFRRALEIWDTLIIQTHATPRSTKRFLNRVRCLAMRLRPVADSRSRWSLLFHSSDALSEETQSASTPLPESMLVALSAIYDVAPEILRNDALYNQALVGRLSPVTQAEVEIDQRVQKIYGEALQEHRAKFSTEWPPTPEQRTLFLNMCADVTVRG